MVCFVLFNPSITKQQLPNNEIHLWSIDPQKVTEQSKLASLETLLNKVEREKIQRYRFAKAQHNALITRAFVRSVLALYVEKEAKDLEFKTNAHGKPELNNSLLPLRFNLSHNDQLIICAVCLDHNIGCDIESLYRKISIKNIAKRYFSVNEYQSLIKLSPIAQQTRFFEYWTLKEAFVKATGQGISQGLDTFSFDIGNSEKSTFNDNITLNLQKEDHLKNSNEWYNSLSYPDKTHCIAICVNSIKKFKIKYFQASDFFY